MSIISFTEALHEVFSIIEAIILCILFLLAGDRSREWTERLNERWIDFSALTLIYELIKFMVSKHPNIWSRITEDCVWNDVEDMLNISF